MIRVEAEKREKLGKEEARKIRKQGFIPAVVYSKGKAYEHVKVRLSDMNKLLKNQATTFELKVEDRIYKVRLQDVQICPLTDKPIHFDLYSLEEPHYEK